MTPTGYQLQLRLDDRLRWFRNEWFFKWHQIKGERLVEIDMFDGRTAKYSGLRFEGSPQDVYWAAIVRGARKEVAAQLAWLEERVRAYKREAAKAALDECAIQLASFVQAVRNTAIEKDAILRGNGLEFPPRRDFGDWWGLSAPEIEAQTAAIVEALFPSGGEEVATIEVQKSSESITPEYQVALSFAGEQRDYVREVARVLQARGVSVFFDEFEKVTLWGKDGVEFFHRLFAANTSYVVMFISKEYVAKKWTRHERRSALSRAIAEEREYVLPVRFDESPIPGIPDTLQYLNAREHVPASLAALIASKLSLGLPAKASDVPSPQVQSLTGEIAFDYSAFNGRLVIGSGVHQFETMWSKSDHTSITLYNDPPSINGVAIAKGAKRIGDIVDASLFDFSSRTRRPKKGEIAVLRNTHGFYAAISILDIKDDTRGHDRDELSIRFAIQPDWSSSFVELLEDN